ncbi:YbaK/EbsC family protein [Photobacterium sanguinicancri]|uniref:YbaK/EbsC family protein n=1 Tax=Photobacterium sanguinicancri TaxID=875932 RepID=A0AAW7Y0J9_9GAMM|nr:YbaK/EbsC family protein [Photobacterium sanguinicancri]KXI24320.1 deacylase [Photobacterium sanguinicancri]MDO6541762.1 YbaK/EbsC family protein [Photobacterium sanguinicancri]
MAMAITVGQFLCAHHIYFSLTKHRHTDTSFSSAVSAHVPAKNVTKAVLLKTEADDYLLAVVPANRRVMLDKVNMLTGKVYALVGEHELSQIFQDCEPGAVPSLGQAYSIPMLVDDALIEKDEWFMEAGDHENLIHMEKKQFQKIIRDCQHKNISSYAIP